MVASLRDSLNFNTYLAPGQRLAASDEIATATSGSVVVTRLVKDHLGLLHVTLCDERGREISAFAEQVEAAIAEGHLVPAGVLVGSA